MIYFSAEEMFMKKIISVLMSLVIVFSTSAAAAGAASDECGCGYVPAVFITGFAQTNLVANAGTREEYSVFPPETKAVISAVKQIILPLFALILTGNYDAFTDSLAVAVNELFADVACDENGELLNKTVDIEFREEPRASHDAYTMVKFRYDWRRDVFDIAADLNEYIERVKKLTGHSQVALCAESMGGAVAMTYLSVYGSDSVETLIMQSSAFCGISLVGGLFTGDIYIKPQSVINYIADFLEGNSADTVFYRALLKGLGGFIASPVAGLLNGFINNSANHGLYAKALVPALGYIPGLWCFVPAEDYEEAKAFMLDADKNAVLIEKLDRYQYEVAAEKKAILDEAIAGGMNLAIISHYGKAAVPVISEDNYRADFLIDTARTSGAVCAQYGGTLGGDYSQAVADGHSHISCDSIIDASTCAYPEYTWFIKDMMHTWYSSGYYYFVYDLIYNEGQETVYTFEQYPQFMLNNHETRELDPLTEENCETDSVDVNFKELINLWADKAKG